MAKILQICAIDVSVDALLKPLIKASMKQGHIVHSACTDTGKFGMLKEEGLHMIHVQIDRKISFLSNIRAMLKLYSIIKKEKYDIVHVHTPIAAVLGRIAARLGRVPHVLYTAHGFYFHEDMPKAQYYFFYLLEKYFARFFTDWLLLQSKEDYELCIGNNFKNKKYILHISNGVDVHALFSPSMIDRDETTKLKNEFKIEQNDVVFSFIGRFVKEKGIFELLEAFCRLKKRYSNVKLLMIGDVFKSERDKKSFSVIQQLLKDESIITTGFRKDIPQLLSISDVFVLPSYREGLPRSIIEAMAMEKPIIATDIRGCREEVLHGKNGFLVERANVDALYERMVELVEDPIKRKQFGKHSRKLAEELFDENKVIAKQLELFEYLSKKK